MKIFSYLDRPKPVSFKCEKLSRTQKQFLQECDINYIVRTFANCEGFVDPSIPRKRTPMFGDFAEIGDFQSHMDNVNKVVDIFKGLPSNVREYFGNSPSIFAEFASNPANIDALVKMRIIERDEASVVRNVNNDTNIKSVTEAERSNSKASDPAPSEG